MELELERDSEGDGVGDLEMEELLEGRALAVCVGEMRGEPLVLGLTVLVWEMDTDTVSVGEALKVPLSWEAVMV